MTVLYDALVDFNYNKDKDYRKINELLTPDMSDFIKNNVTTSMAKYGEIVSKYLPNLTDWTWDRIPLLTQAILLMSYTHYYYLGPVDRKIVINIAVELAKTYIDEKQSAFVNAILEKVIA